MKLFLAITMLVSLPIAVVIFLLAMPLAIIGALGSYLLTKTARWLDYLAAELERLIKQNDT